MRNVIGVPPRNREQIVEEVEGHSGCSSPESRIVCGLGTKKGPISHFPRTEQARWVVDFFFPAKLAHPQPAQ